MDYYFSTEQLSVGYQGKPVISEIEIGLNQGEILTLIGPNGAGKSTILKSIAGQLELIAGTISLEQKDLIQMTGNERAQKMAVVLTERLKSEMMTCEDVVATGRYPYTGKFGLLQDEDRQKIREAMELVHVTEIKEQDFKKISDGQRQRVMLARAICQEPEIIILDEPTSFLDVKYKLEFLSMLQNLKKQKQLTVIMSIHELELAERVSDRILCVNGTYVDRYGTPEDIFTPGYMRTLFSIETGNFDEENSSMELEPPKGTPEVFVIAGGGRGRNVYRRLQRAGVPFATGILFENDLDIPVANALATEVVKTKAFEPVPVECVKKAKEILRKCEKVICCQKTFGTWEEANASLAHYAQQLGKELERKA